MYKKYKCKDVQSVKLKNEFQKRYARAHTKVTSL